MGLVEGPLVGHLRRGYAVLSRASADVLDAIHGLLAGALKDELERALEAARREEDPVPINPQLLDKVMKFLKDNDITAPLSSKPLNDLSQKLSELDVDLDNEVVDLRH